MSRYFTRWITSFFDIKKGERLTAVLMFLYFFIVITSYYVIKPVRNSLFIDRLGADNLPYVYILTAIFVGFIFKYYPRIVYRITTIKLIIWTFMILVVNLVLFRWWMQYQMLITSGAFYIWAKLYPVLLVSQFWLLGSELYTTRQAKRLYGFIGTGGIIGGIAGSTIANRMATVVGSENLLFISGALLVACSFLVYIIKRSSGKSEDSQRSSRYPFKSQEEYKKGSWKLIKESPHLKTIGIILGLTVVVSTMIDWQFNKATDIFIAGKDQKTAFFGGFFAIQNFASVVIQFFFTSFILRTFGIGIALILLPMGLLTGSLGILIHPALWTAVLAKGADGTLRYSLDQSTRELLFIPVPTVKRLSAKPFIDIVVARGGTGVAGVFLLIMIKFISADLMHMSIITVGLILLWIRATMIMRSEFGESIRTLLNPRDVELEELIIRNLDADSIHQLTDSLDSEDPDRVLFALALLEGIKEDVLLEKIPQLLQHPSSKVKTHVLKFLTERNYGHYVTNAQSLVKDQSIDVRAQAVHYVCNFNPGESESAVLQYLESQEPGLRAAAVCCIANYGKPEMLDSVKKILIELAAQEKVNGTSGKVLVAETLGNITGYAQKNLQPLLQDLLMDNDFRVQRKAMMSAGIWRDTSFIPLLISRLCCPQTRDTAQTALASYGHFVYEELLRDLADPHVPMEIRIAIPAVFYRKPTQPVIAHLINMMNITPPYVKSYILKTLNKIRRNYPEFYFNPKMLESVLLKDTILGYRLFIHVERLREHAGQNLQEIMLVKAMDERKNYAVERISRILALMYPLKNILGGYYGLISGDSITKSFGFELLDNTLSRKHKNMLTGLLDPELNIEQKMSKAISLFPELSDDEPVEIILEKLTQIQFDPWIASLASLVLDRQLPNLVPALREPFKEMLLPRIGKSFNQILAGEKTFMHTIVERAEFLKNVEIFSRLSTENIAKVAAIMAEREYNEGENLFREGEIGDELIVVMEGKILVARGQQEILTATRGNAVGMLAVLEAQCSEFTATAVEKSRVLILKREDLYDLMHTRFAIVEGLIAYLTNLIRTKLDIEYHTS